MKESFRKKLVRSRFKVGWTRGMNGRGTADEESGCVQSGW